ncbi:MAG: PQQ-binding-like beta-propeller repeat protein [bacterium]|nr:PQQ-binding-like beta-propeller repeat protein [bacterium]
MPEKTIEPTRVWRMAGGCASRGSLSSAAFAQSPVMLNALSAQAAATTAPVFAEDGRVFIADRSGAVQAFDPDGTLIWRTDLPGRIEASPALSTDDALLFTGTLDGRVDALNAKTGKIAWETYLPSERDPRILSDVLFSTDPRCVAVSSWGGKFSALHPESGEIVSQWDAGVVPYAAMTAAGGALYAIRAEWTGQSQGLRAFKTQPGEAETSLIFQPAEEGYDPRKYTALAAPVSEGVRVYFIVNRMKTSRLIAFGVKDDEQKWSLDLPCNVHADPALGPDGTLTLACMDGRVKQVNAEKGSIEWEYDAKTEYLLSAPARDAKGRAALGDPAGCVHLIEPGGEGKTIFETDRAFQGRAAVAPDGRFFAPCTDGKVYVFGCDC